MQIFFVDIFINQVDISYQTKFPPGLKLPPEYSISPFGGLPPNNENQKNYPQNIIAHEFSTVHKC